jgi:hypothetical protein
MDILVNFLLGKFIINNIKALRFLAASSLLLTGLIHLVLIAYTTEMEMGIMALFGILYVLIGIGLLIDKRIFRYLGVIIPLFGAILGVYSYVLIKSEITSLLLIGIDIIVILCCSYLILNK